LAALRHPDGNGGESLLVFGLILERGRLISSRIQDLESKAFDLSK
jgi:hypothetical protein